MDAAIPAHDRVMAHDGEQAMADRLGHRPFNRGEKGLGLVSSSKRRGDAAKGRQEIRLRHGIGIAQSREAVRHSLGDRSVTREGRTLTTTGYVANQIWPESINANAGKIPARFDRRPDMKALAVLGEGQRR